MGENLMMQQGLGVHVNIILWRTLIQEAIHATLEVFGENSGMNVRLENEECG